MTANQPKLELTKIKIYDKPIKLSHKISLLNADKKIKMTPVTALWPKKDEENDRLPKSGTGQ